MSQDETLDTRVECVSTIMGGAANTWRAIEANDRYRMARTRRGLGSAASRPARSEASGIGERTHQTSIMISLVHWFGCRQAGVQDRKRMPQQLRASLRCEPTAVELAAMEEIVPDPAHVNKNAVRPKIGLRNRSVPSQHAAFDNLLVRGVLKDVGNRLFESR